MFEFKKQVIKIFYEKHLKSKEEKQDTFKDWPITKNPHFLSDPHETW